MKGPPGFEELITHLESLAQSRVSGALEIELENRRAVLGLEQGTIVRVEERDRKAHLLLGQLAVRRGILSSSRMTELLETCSRCELGRSMVDAGLLSPEGLAELRALQVEEILGQLAVAPLGETRFDPGASPQPQPGLEPIPLPDLIHDLERRVEEWPLLVKRIGSQDRVVEQLPTAAEPLPPREQALLSLVDGRREVGTLLQLSGMGEFLTLRMLYTMLQQRRVRLVGDREPETTSPAETARPGAPTRRQQSYTVLLTILAILLLSAIGTHGFSLFPNRPQFTTLGWDAVLRQETLARVHAAIEVCRLLQGGLPVDQEGLTTHGCVQPEDLEQPDGSRSFEYQRHGDATYSLLPVP